MLRVAPAVCGVVVLTLVCPSAAEDTPRSLLLNPGAEQGKKDQPSVWAEASVAAAGLRMWRDTEIAHSGEASLAISNSHAYESPVSNNWMQRLSEAPRGRRVRLRVAIRTEDADAANVCLQCWDATGETLLAFASTPVFRGDQTWIEVTSQAVIVPEATDEVVVRAALTGVGKAWFDDCRVEVVAKGERRPRQQVAGTGTRPNAVHAADVGEDTPDVETLSEELNSLAPGRLVGRHPIVKDCMILAYMSGWNHGEVDNLAVANNGGGVRALLGWAPIPEAEAADPGLRFYAALYSRKTTSRADAGTVEVRPITAEWPEKTSWSSQPTISEGEASTTVEFAPGEGWKLFDVTECVRRSPATQGAMLRFRDEEKASGAWSGYAFVSSEGIGEWRSRRPVLLVVESEAD